MRLFELCFQLLLLVLLVKAQTKLPFKMKGPKNLNDRIAIVGGGPAGVHMALSLKERNFTNVIILERSGRLGGKSWTINRRGAPQEMGTVYLQPDYKDLIIPLVHKYVGQDELRVLPAASIWLDHSKRGLTFRDYVIQYAKQHFNTSNEEEVLGSFVNALKKYVYLHKTLLGVYEGEIMPEPTKETFYKLRGTFMDFLKRNDIDVIASVFYASETVQGYGRIDEVPTLYGMMWNTPKLIEGLVKRMEGKDDETGFYMLKHGFSNLWKKIVRKEKLKVKYNIKIKQIYRPRNGKGGVWMQLRRKPRYHNHRPKRYVWEKFDFVIWSPELKTSLRYWDTFKDERFYFSRTRPVWFTTALVDSMHATKGPSPIDYWFDNINMKRQDVIWAQRDSYPALRNCIGQQYQSGNCPAGNDGKDLRTTVAYLMSDRPPYRGELIKNLKDALREINATHIKIHRFKTWRYFPRYSTRDTEKGYLWRILEMQGKHSMWYIGASACFESVKSVIDYNALILTNFDTPTN